VIFPALLIQLPSRLSSDRTVCITASAATAGLLVGGVQGLLPVS
jgi:hypothetical protein